MSRPRLRAAVAGATGVVGQHLVSRLTRHPWFGLTAVAASQRSAGRSYGEAVHWVLAEPPPAAAAGLPVLTLDQLPPVDVVFSALDSAAAGDGEAALAARGLMVVSNASAHRLQPGAPLLLPEVNPDHVAVLRRTGRGGGVVTNPNCCVAGLALALKPLADAFGIEAVTVTTLQAVSGAGYPGLPSLDVLGNVIPLIPGEEEKIARETAAILGRVNGDGVQPLPIPFSVQAIRVPVPDGHTLSVSVRFARKAGVEDVRQVMTGFRAPHCTALPSAPEKPLLVLEGAAPQPRLHLEAGGGMAVTVGRLRACPVQDVCFVALVHNAVRGAAGAALLNGELLAAAGLLGVEP